MSGQDEGLRAVLAAHRYRDVRGDYEMEPYRKHFGCSCGWQQDIGGMSGYWSWVAAHEAHIADAITAHLGATLAGLREDVATLIADTCGGTHEPDAYDGDGDDWRLEADAVLAVVRVALGLQGAQEAHTAPLSAEQPTSGPAQQDEPRAAGNE